MSTSNLFCESLEDIFKNIEILKKRCKGAVYFRGHSNVTYRLISSFQREYVDSYEQYIGKDIEQINIILKSIKDEKTTYENFLQKYTSDIEAIKIISKISNLEIIKTDNLAKERSLISFMQHYETKTRALDFTSNLLVALYFVVRTYQENAVDGDGALWLLDRHMLFELIYNMDRSEYVKLSREVEYKEGEEYISSLNAAINLYEKRINKLEKKEYTTYYDNIVDMKELLQDIEEIPVLGKERHSMLVENLYSNGLNERICRQSGVFVIQRFVPTSIDDEYDHMISTVKKGHFEAKGNKFPDDEIYSPFKKIIISQKCFSQIREFLSLVGITNKTLGI